MTLLAGPAPTGCGCDDPSTAPRLVGIDAALARIATQFGPVRGTRRIALSAARGRVLARDVVALSDMPRFDHAAMDGYALCRADLTGDGPWQIPVSQRCAAGDGPVPALAGGTAARILTGAPVPDGADCVVAQESVLRNRDRITLSHRPGAGENIRVRGEEQGAGSPILIRGTRLTSRAIAAVAAGGHGHVEVRRKLRVALLVSGSEVVPPGTPSPPVGAIWDVNTPMLGAVLSRPDIRLRDVGIMPDDEAGICARLAQAAGGCDLIVTTGGVSVGDEDHLRTAFRRIGGVGVFSGVAMKPGKPVSCGMIDGTAWLGLPGNPQSAYVTWTLFGTALLARLTGCSRADHTDHTRRPVLLSHRLHRRPGRSELRAARVLGVDRRGREIVACDRAVHSGRVGALGTADGLVVLPADVEQLPRGASVEFLPFCFE